MEFKMPARIASGSLGYAWITATKPASICPPAPSGRFLRRGLAGVAFFL
jgi:hypothetical protein